MKSPYLLLLKKKRGIISILFSILFLSAFGIYLYQRSVSHKRACLLNQRQLWAAARSYCLCEGLAFEEPIEVISLSDYFVKFGIPVCPSGNEPYPSFSALLGPTCPHGHDIDNETRRVGQLTMKCESLWRHWRYYGSRDSSHIEELIYESRDESRAVRMAAVEYLGKIYSDVPDPKILEVLEAIIHNDENPYVRDLAQKAITPKDVSQDTNSDHQNNQNQDDKYLWEY